MTNIDDMLKHFTHLEQHKYGSSVLNVLGMFDSQLNRFGSLCQKFKEASVLIHLDKVPDEYKERTFKVLVGLKGAMDVMDVEEEFALKKSRRLECKKMMSLFQRISDCSRTKVSKYITRHM